MKNRIPLFIFLLPCLAVGAVNTEKLRNLKQKQGFSGYADSQISIITGNSEIRRIGLGARLQHETFYASDKKEKDSKSLVFLVGNLNSGIKSGNSFISKGFSHLRWTRMWVPRLGTELFTQYQYNEFKKLSARSLLGAGGRWVITRGQSADLYFGTGYFYEFEKLDIPVGSTADQFSRQHRWNNYFSFNTSISDGLVNIGNTVYFQPRLDEFSDFRISNEGEIKFTISSTLSFLVSMSIGFDSAPPPGVKQLDTTTTNKIRFSF